MYRCTEPGIGRLLASRKRTNSSFKDAAWHSANGLNGYNVNAHRKPLLLAIRDTRRKLIDALDRVTLKQARFHDYYVTQVFCNRILDFRMCNESMLRVDFSNNTVDIVRISDTGISGRCRMRRCFRRKREREKEREKKAICCCSRYALVHCDAGEIDDAHKTHRWHYRADTESFEDPYREQSHSDVQVWANNRQNGGNVENAGLRRILGRWHGGLTTWLENKPDPCLV